MSGRGPAGAFAAALLVAACLGCGGGGRPDAAPRRDVLLVILDTTRADHLSSYGALHLTTPNLDALAAEGERFDAAWSQSPWTLPSIATILTGLPPHLHGAGRAPDGRMYGVRDRVSTLAERLAAAGWSTAAFINVVWCDPRLSSLDRGFERYDFASSDETNVGQRDARATTDVALDWLAAAGEAPVFMVVHYFDPHLTYDPPAPYDTMFDDGAGADLPRGFGSAQDVFAIREGRERLDPARRAALRARYDGELRYVDDQFARLRRAFESAGRWDRTLVVVVGDHGEEFWDHGGFEHGHSHHREVLRVPLIVRRPGGAAGVVRAGRVRQLDVAPTVLEWAGIPAADLPGHPLGERPAEFAVAEGSLWAGDLVSLRSDAGTLILDRSRGDLRYYAASDVDERHPLPAAAAPPRAVELLRAVPAGRAPDDAPRELTPEQEERLRSLGYLR